jgi:hypothetical protein
MSENSTKIYLRDVCCNDVVKVMLSKKNRVPWHAVMLIKHKDNFNFSSHVQNFVTNLFIYFSCQM